MRHALLFFSLAVLAACTVTKAKTDDLPVRDDDSAPKERPQRPTASKALPTDPIDAPAEDAQPPPEDEPDAAAPAPTAAECDVDDDCALGTICVAQACVEGCYGTIDCASESFCWFDKCGDGPCDVGTCR